MPEFGFLGQSSFSGGFAPTFGFVFGSQADILDKAIRNGWLLSRGADQEYYARNYSKSHFDKFDYSANVRFTRDLDIELFGNRTYTESFNQQLDVIDGVLNDTPRNGVGNFSISQFMLGSSLKDADELFQTFKDNRAPSIAFIETVPASVMQAGIDRSTLPGPSVTTNIWPRATMT